MKKIRNEHESGVRDETAIFNIVMNQEPSESLMLSIQNNSYPADVHFIWPNNSTTQLLPPAWASLSDAIQWCKAQAAKLNFSLLSPETLVWKLAGLVQLASSGGE